MTLKNLTLGILALAAMQIGADRYAKARQGVDNYPTTTVTDAKLKTTKELAAKPAPQPPRSASPIPAAIDRNGVIILVRRALLSVQDANETGNYTVLRDLAAPGFRRLNNATRLSEIFGELRRRDIDLSGVAALDPQLTLLPQIESDGYMHLAGVFPSVPTQITFDLRFAPVDGRWRPDTIGVGLSSATPNAPPTAATDDADTKPQPTPVAPSIAVNGAKPAPK